MLRRITKLFTLLFALSCISLFSGEMIDAYAIAPNSTEGEQADYSIVTYEKQTGWAVECKPGCDLNDLFNTTFEFFELFMEDVHQLRAEEECQERGFEGAENISFSLVCVPDHKYLPILVLDCDLAAKFSCVGELSDPS